MSKKTVLTLDSILALNTNLNIKITVLTSFIICVLLILALVPVSGSAQEIITSSDNSANPDTDSSPLSTDKASYEIEETVIISISIPEGKASDYDLMIKANNNSYTYKGEFNPEMFFYPTEEGIYTIALVEKSTGAPFYSLSFKVIDPDSQGAVSESPDKKPNATQDDSGVEPGQEEPKDPASTVHSLPSLPSAPSSSYQASITLSQEKYIEGRTVHADVHLPENQGYALYLMHDNLKKKYMSDLKHVMFAPESPGRYSLVLENSRGEITTQRNFRVVPSVAGKLKKNFRIINSQGLLSGREMRILNETLESATLEIVPEQKLRNKGLKKIIIKRLNHGNFNFTPGHPGLRLGIDYLPQNKLQMQKIKEKNVIKAYAVDPSMLNFSQGEITATAEGDELWKCREWEFESQSCLGAWKKIADLTPGQEYNITITPNDPGFAETGINIINVKSYPVVGGDWTVGFTTTGAADLIIKAGPNTSWLNSSQSRSQGEDLRFIGLTCGNQTIEYEWQAGSVIVSDYSCNQTGYETTRVLTTGVHVLEFRFGDDIKYAYNNASNWWNLSWGRRRRINVSVGANSPFNGYENYTVQMTVNTTGNQYKGNGNDIRIVYWNGTGNQELDREIIDNNTVNTRIRFRLKANISASSYDASYYLYYNNSQAQAGPSNLSRVYLWHDNASTNRSSQYKTGKLDDSGHGCGGTCYPPSDEFSWHSAGYYYVYTGDNYVESFRPADYIEKDIYIEYEAYQVNAYGNHMTSGPVVRWNGTGSAATEDSDHFFYYSIAGDTYTNGQYSHHGDICYDDRIAVAIDGPSQELFPATTWTRLGIAVWGSGPANIKAYYNNESGGWNGYRFNGSYSDNPNTGEFGVWVQQDDSRFRNIIARRYTEPEPSLTLLNEVEPYAPQVTNAGLNTTEINQSESVRINVTVIDESNVAVNVTVKYWNNTDRNFTMAKGTGNSYYYIFTNTNNTGTYNVTNIIAEDEHGNVNNTAYTSLGFTVTASPPGLFNLLLPDNNTFSSELQPNLSWQQTTESHFANYTILLDKDSSFGSPDFTYATYEISNTSYVLDSAMDPNDAYYWRVVAYDIFGNSRNSTDKYVYTTDSIDPLLSLNWPGDNDVITVSGFDFNYTPNDNNLVNCTLYANFTGLWDENQTNTSPQNNQPNYFSISLDDGSYLWNVECVDKANRTGFAPSNYSLKIDTQPPLVRLEAPRNNSYENETNNLVFYYNVTDEMSSIDNCILIVDGSQTGLPDTSVEEVKTQNFTAFVGNGQHNWSVNCTDSNGLTGASPRHNLSVNVTQETDPPLITLNFPKPEDFFATSQVTFNYTPKDASGIKNCSLYIDSSLNQTNHSVNNNVPNYFTVSGLSQTKHSWRIKCYDNLTYANTTTSIRNFTIDLTNPVVVLNRPGDNNFFNGSDVLFNYTPSDDNLNNCTLYGNFSGGFSPDQTNTSPLNSQTNHFNKYLDDGSYLWNVECIDRAGRSRFSLDNYTVLVDSRAPTLENVSESPSSPANYSPGQTYKFNISVGDAFLDHVWIEHNFSGMPGNYSVNDSDGNVYLYNYSGLSAGSYAYTWFANDSLGRINSTARGYLLNQADSEVSLLINNTDSDFSINEGRSVNISADMVTPASGYIELYQDAVLINNGSAPLNNITFFSEPGIYNITAIYPATENYSQGRETHFLRVNDTTAPNISLISPQPGARLGDLIVTFYYNVSDASTILNCSLYINGSLNQTNYSVVRDIQQSFSVSFTQGNYTWQVKCYDNASRQGLSGTRNFSVQETTNVSVVVNLNMSDYEEGEPALINITSQDELGNPLQTNVTTSIIYTNNTITTAPWWNASWPLRKKINVSVGANSPFNGYENYTVQMTVNTTGNQYKGNGNDIRIVYWNGTGNQELDREIIDNNTVNTRIRFRLKANISASSYDASYYLYYNNSQAQAGPSNLSRVYLWHDDASSDRESEYTQGRMDSSAHGSDWANSITWNSSGHYDFDTTDNYADSLRPAGMKERDVYVEYEEYQTGAYSSDMTSGPIARWNGTGTGVNEDSSHWFYYEMTDSTYEGGSYTSHDDITADDRESVVIAHGTLGSFPATTWTRLGIAVWGSGPANIKAYYNNESGGWNGYRFNGSYSDNPNTGEFGVWVQQDAGRIRNIISRRYTEPEPSLALVEHVEAIVQVSSNQTNNFTGTTNFSFDTSSQAYGNYSVVSTGSKTNYNDGSGATYFNLGPDVTGPVVTIIRPENRMNISSNNYGLNATANDAARDVDTVTFMYRQNSTDSWRTICNDDQGPYYNCSWNLTNLPDANSYQLRAYGNDTLGNTGGNDTRYNITVDRTGPNTTLGKPDSMETIIMLGGGFYTVNASTVDALSSIDVVVFEYRVNATAGWESACQDSQGPVYNCSWDLTVLENGEDYQVRAYANDSLGNSGSADSHINITVITESINITSVVLDDELGIPVDEIDLSAGSTRLVRCNMTITDPDVYTDIQEVNATLYSFTSSSGAADHNRTHYTNASCSLVTGGGPTADYTCAFNVWHYAVNGSWNCTGRAANAFASDQATDNTTINQLFAINISSSVIDYSDLQPNQTSSDVQVDVSNVGNMPMNISVYGFGGIDEATGQDLSMVCEINNISVSFEKFSTSSATDYNSKNSLSSSPQDIGLTIQPKNEPADVMVNSTYWQFMVPPDSHTLGECNGSVVFMAESP